MRLDLGDDRTREWLEGIKANQPKIYENNIQTEEAIARGEVDVGFVNHYYAYELRHEQPNFPVRNHFLRKGDPGSLVNAAGAGILATVRRRSPTPSGSPATCSRARARPTSRRRRSSTRSTTRRRAARGAAAARRPARTGDQAGGPRRPAAIDARDARPGRPDVVTRRPTAALGALAVAVVALVSLPVVYLIVRVVDGGSARVVGARAAGHARRGRQHGRDGRGVDRACGRVRAADRVARRAHGPAGAAAVGGAAGAAAGRPVVRDRAGADRRVRAGRPARASPRSTASTGPCTRSRSRRIRTSSCCAARRCGVATAAQEEAARSLGASAVDDRAAGDAARRCARRSRPARCWSRCTRCRTSASCR